MRRRRAGDDEDAEVYDPGHLIGDITVIEMTDEELEQAAQREAYVAQLGGFGFRSSPKQ